uniref:Membrane spanning 4-domains A3 n=1 Tax=Callithrix jacchus TaxID=9483 RepID=A0A2R8MSV2_CALJA
MASREVDDAELGSASAHGIPGSEAGPDGVNNSVYQPIDGSQDYQKGELQFLGSIQYEEDTDEDLYKWMKIHLMNSHPDPECSNDSHFGHLSGFLAIPVLLQQALLFLHLLHRLPSLGCCDFLYFRNLVCCSREKTHKNTGK